jgi:hypothetical protein
LWQGASLIDGAPIVVIATGLERKSANAKTGGMVQTYILRAEMEPTAAIKAGADVSICGACPHRGDGTGKGRTCYVNVGQGPLGVWRAWKRGAYPHVGADGSDGICDIYDAGKGRVVRLGTYGDPAAVPFGVWNTLTAGCVAHTGYTHQWRKCDPALRSLVMASADGVQDAADAHAAGWRTFRVAMPCDAPKLDGEARCPASAEMGKRLTCEQCRACNGNATGRRGSIVIQAHGGFAVMANVRSKVPVPHSVSV